MGKGSVTLGSGPQDGIRLEGVGLLPGHCRFEAHGPHVLLVPGAGPMLLHRRERPAPDGGWSEQPPEQVSRPLALCIHDRLSWPDPAGASRDLRLVPGFFRARLGLAVHEIGAAPDCAVPLPFPHISQRRAVLFEAPDG